MPPKMTTCSICGKEVTKKSTLMMNDGSRACRSHDGIEDQSLKRIKKENENRRRQQQRFRERTRAPRDNYIPHDFKPKCMICGHQPVMLARDFYQRAIIEMEKHKITHTKVANLFDVEGAKKIFGKLMDYRPIYPITKKLNKNLEKFVPRRFRDAVDVVGFIWACNKCIGEHSLDTGIPEIKPEDMLTVGMALGKIMKPVFKAIAEKELLRDN